MHSYHQRFWFTTKKVEFFEDIQGALHSLQIQPHRPHGACCESHICGFNGSTMPYAARVNGVL